MVTTISRPSLPRLPKLPGGIPAVDLATLEEAPASGQIVDEFGLALSIYERFPREQRRLIAKAFSEVGGDKRGKPPLGATIVEWIVFGLLLDHNFSYRQGQVGGARSFTFQSYELGGRQPGGSVVDFMVYHNAIHGRGIAVRVQSVFHDLRNPFGGGGQVQQVEARLKRQLMATFFVDRVVDVNRPPERVLETSPSSVRVHQEMWRILGYMP